MPSFAFITRIVPSFAFQSVMGSHPNSLVSIAAIGGILTFVYLSYRQHEKSEQEEASGRSTSSSSAAAAGAAGGMVTLQWG